jgi:hypothetical protein
VEEEASVGWDMQRSLERKKRCDSNSRRLKWSYSVVVNRVLRSNSVWPAVSLCFGVGISLLDAIASVFLVYAGWSAWRWAAGAVT